MRKILVIGAGRSASTLIQYLLEHAHNGEWTVVVADLSKALAMEKIAGHPAGEAVELNVNDAEARRKLIGEAELVISLAPAALHIEVARDCLAEKKNLITASYISPEMQALDEEVQAAGLLFLNEMGLDPGIDHMSAMEMLDDARSRESQIVAFRSWCGALVAPDSNNEWGYKFTWAPKNIVLAGQGGPAQYISGGEVQLLPYERLFAEAEEIEVPGWGKFEGYKNRDSLRYLPLYGLEGLDTFYRATLRFKGYCRFWNQMIRLGLTDDSTVMENLAGKTRGDFLSSFLKTTSGKTLLESLAAFIGEPASGDTVRKIFDLGLTGDVPLTLDRGTPADILLSILEKHWVFEPDDHDMVVMQHQLDTRYKGRIRRLTSSLVLKGRDPVHTAVSRTVGLPAAIAARLMMTSGIAKTGVLIPNFREIYDPVLRELEDEGIRFETNLKDIM